MALIHIVRDIPEYKGGDVEADIPEQDFPILNKRGWRKADSKPSKEFGKGNLKADEVITPENIPEKNTFKGGTK